MAENKGGNPDSGPSESGVRTNRRDERDSRSWEEKRENATQTRDEVSDTRTYSARTEWRFMDKKKGRNPDSGPSESDVRAKRRHERDSRSWPEKREYRVRPRVAEDCRHYVRTGQCKYGEGCKYNHPPRPEGNQMRHDTVQTRPAPVRAQLPESNQMRHDMVQTRPAQVRAQFPESNQMRHDMVQTRPAQVRAQFPERNQMNDMVQTSSYPVRPGAINCEHYLRTGLCSFGSDCRLNHPPNHVAKGWRRKKANRRICKFFKGGNCKNGPGCAFYHQMDVICVGTESSSMAEKRATTVQDSGECNPSERPQDNPENRNDNAQENLQEQADMEGQMREVQEKAQEERRQRELQRREARLRIEQMRPTAQLDNLIQIRESLPGIGIKRKEGDGF